MAKQTKAFILWNLLLWSDLALGYILLNNRVVTNMCGDEIVQGKNNLPLAIWAVIHIITGAVIIANKVTELITKENVQ